MSTAQPSAPPQQRSTREDPPDPVPTIAVDAAGRITECSAQALLACPAITHGQTFLWHALVPPERRDAARSRLQELLSAAHDPLTPKSLWPCDAGSALLPANPPQRSFRWLASPLPSTVPEGTGLLLSASTASTSLSPPIPSSPPSFEAIAEATPFGIIVLSEMADLLYANPQHRLVLGFSAAECGSMNAWLQRALASPQHQPDQLLDEWWERVWRRRQPWTCSMRTSEGILKEIEFRPSPLPSHHLLVTILDVTDARLEEQSLRASEARYRGLFQNCAAAVAILNASGSITEVNPTFISLTGFSRLEIRRSGISTILPAAESELIRRIASSASLETDFSSPLETSITARDGSVTPASLSLSVTRNSDGSPIYTALFLHPLPASRPPAPPPAGSSSLTRIVPDLVLQLDSSGRILACSQSRDFPSPLPSGESLEGRSLDAFLPTIAEQLPLDTMMDRLRSHPNAETRCSFATPFQPASPPRTIEARMVLLPKPAGTAPEFGLVIRDVTAVAASAATSSSPGPWLQNLSLPAILLNDRGRITSINPAAEQFLGYPARELAGHGLYQLFQPENPSGFSAEISRHLNSQRRWQTTTTARHADGTPLPVSVELVPSADDGSGARGFFTLLTPTPTETTEDHRPAITLHRARNDVQLLSSLFALHSDQSDGPVRDAINASRDRLSCIALIYRLISSEADPVDFARYTSELCHSFAESRRTTAAALRISVTADPLALPQKSAITLGVILGELLSTAIRACGTATGSLIAVALRVSPRTASLSVSDNSPRLSETSRRIRTESLPWRIVETLAAQSGASVSLTSTSENEALISFPLAALAPLHPSNEATEPSRITPGRRD
jgi:PAS domain S-box-containing protein